MEKNRFLALSTVQRDLKKIETGLCVRASTSDLTIGNCCQKERHNNFKILWMTMSSVS